MSDEEPEPGRVAHTERPAHAGVRWFSSTPGAPRERRPTDVLLVALALLALLLVYVLAPLPRRWDLLADLTLSAVGVWLWTIFLGVLAAWSLALVVVAVALRHWSLLRDQLVAAVVAAALATVLPQVTPSGSSPDGVAHPALQLAIATALVVTTAPHIVVPARHVGRWLVFIGLLAAAATDAGGLAAALAALALGWAVGAGVHLALGSPGGQLTGPDVLAALAAIGVDARDLEESRLNDRGVAVVRGRAADGAPLLVKVYGRDAWDAQLMASVWSGLWYRRPIPATRPSRIAQVEHEAFATLLAERAGVPVLPVIAAGMVDDRDAVLVIEAGGAPVTTAAADADLLAGYWHALGRLHQIGLCHGAVTPQRLVVRLDGSAALADLGAARTAPARDDILVDRAQLLVSTALVTDPEQAVAAAAAGLGPGALGDVVPMLQSAAIDPSLRRAIRAADWGMKDLRERTVAASGREAPELARLRRVTPMSVLGVVVVVLLAYVLINAVTGIGWATLVDQLRDADPVWALAAILLAPLIQVGSAFSTMGAAPRRVRFGPVLALQYAIQFTGLAVPTVAARVAVAMRFFQRVGLGPTAAVAVGAIDGFSGFVVQAILLIIIGVAGLTALTVPPLLQDFDPSWALIAAIVLAVIAIAMAIPPVRRVVLARVSEARESLRILRSPRNVALLLGGNLVAQLLAACVLGLSVVAMGHQVPYPELLLILTLVSLFAGLMPVPGGIGVTEAALTFGLTAAGLPEAAALSSAIVFRLATYYLPPAYGAVAMWWLRSRSYV